MYKVELYVRVRRACMVEGMSTREAARVSVCTGTRCARCWSTRCHPGTVDSHRRVALSWTRTTG